MAEWSDRPGEEGGGGGGGWCCRNKDSSLVTKAAGLSCRGSLHALCFAFLWLQQILPFLSIRQNSGVYPKGSEKSLFLFSFFLYELWPFETKMSTLDPSSQVVYSVWPNPFSSRVVRYRWFVTHPLSSYPDAEGRLYTLVKFRHKSCRVRFRKYLVSLGDPHSTLTATLIVCLDETRGASGWQQAAWQLSLFNLNNFQKMSDKIKLPGKYMRMS